MCYQQPARFHYVHDLLPLSNKNRGHEAPFNFPFIVTRLLCHFNDLKPDFSFILTFFSMPQMVMRKITTFILNPIRGVRAVRT